MNFKEAIDLGILVDYKIIAVGINNEEINKYIQERKFINPNSNESIDDIANNFALQKIMDKYKSGHALTFHSKVKYARQFSERNAKIYTNNDFYSNYVSGKQQTSERNLILNKFSKTSKAIISNARCLTEGVDIPAIDVVYFCDPKNSKVDILQAVGRALRKDSNNIAKIGLIVVPIYHQKEEELDVVISKE